MAALECRSETETVLTVATFDSKQMNWAILAEFVLAVLVTQMDVFNRLLDTTPISLAQFGWALVPALALLVLWELGKLVARSGRGSRELPRHILRPLRPATRSRSHGAGPDGPTAALGSSAYRAILGLASCGLPVTAGRSAIDEIRLGGGHTSRTTGRLTRPYAEGDAWPSSSTR